jgi:aspartate carbamoyltransferase catalytic subunit
MRREKGEAVLKGKCLLEPLDFSVEEMDGLFADTERIIASPEKYSEACKGKILATLFFEPSTRTRLSFEAAMLRLGGQVIGFAEAASSSVAKGESLADTIRTVSCYADLAVIRHPKEGAPKVAAMNASIPVINAGDGGHQHPTQTLTDLITLKMERGGFEGLTIGLCGDLRFGRTVHSLIKALSRYEGVTFVLISPEELMAPEYVRRDLEMNGAVRFEETRRLQDVIHRLDALYMTRVQRERFFNEEDYIRLKDIYILDAEKMKAAKPDMIVLHPLPRVNEIAAEVDDDPRAVYFKQARNGMFVRMALILALLGIETA